LLGVLLTGNREIAPRGLDPTSNVVAADETQFAGLDECPSPASFRPSEELSEPTAGDSLGNRHAMLARPLVPTDGDESPDDERGLTTRPDLFGDLGQDRHVEIAGVGITLGELLPNARDDLVAFAPPDSPPDQSANRYTTIRSVQPNASSQLGSRQRNLSTLVSSCCVEKNLVPCDLAPIEERHAAGTRSS
jgi:hypothetical protein